MKPCRCEGALVLRPKQSPYHRAGLLRGQRASAAARNDIVGSYLSQSLNGFVHNAPWRSCVSTFNTRSFHNRSIVFFKMFDGVLETVRLGMFETGLSHTRPVHALIQPMLHLAGLIFFITGSAKINVCFFC